MNKRRHRRRLRISLQAPLVAASTANTTRSERCAVVDLNARRVPLLRLFGRITATRPEERIGDDVRLAAIEDVLVAAFIANARVRIVLRDAGRRRLVAGHIERWEGAYVIVAVAHDTRASVRVLPLGAIDSVHLAGGVQ